MRKLILPLVSALLCLAAGARDLPDKAFGKFRYTVHYEWGIIDSNVANATISFEKKEWNNKDACHSHAVISANSIFRLFMNADYIADAYLTEDKQPEPLYFSNGYQKDGKQGKFEYTYTKTNILSVNELGDKKEKSDIKQDGLTMDLLSLLHFVRFVDISAGKTLHMHVLIAGKAFPATLSYKGVTKERYPGHEAEHLHLEMTERGLMENGSGNKIELYRSTSPGNVFLGMEVPLSAGSMTVHINEK